MKKTLFFLAAVLTFSFAAKAQTAFSENFQGGSMPSGWTTIADDLVNYNGSPYNQFGQSWEVTQVSSDGNYAAISISYTTPEGNDCDRWLITPAITVPGSGYCLKADIWGRSVSYPEKVKIMISTTGTNKSDFTQVLDVVMDGSHYNTGWNTVLVNLDSYAGQPIYIAFVNYGDGYYTFVDNVEVTVVPANSISAVSASASAWSAQNGVCNVNLTVRNQGSAPLAAFDVTYSVNGGDEDTLNVAGVDIAPFTDYTYTFPVQLFDLGVALINITVSNPNNDTDPDANDNSTSCTTNVYDPNVTTQRNTVLEHFTTAKCPNCPSAHDRLDAAVNGNEDRVIWIAHHVGYYTDAMTISESNHMLRFFNSGSTYAPAIMLDRTHWNAQAFATDGDGSYAPGPVFFPSSDVSNGIQTAISTPSLVSVNISDVNYDPQTRQLSLTVSGNFIGGMSFDSPRLSVYLMQDHIMAAQSGATGQYDHSHVLRACITDVWGDATAITNTTAGSTFSKTYTYTLPTSFNAQYCWVGAFVNNYSNDVNNCEIANGAKTGYLLNGTDPTYVGITAVEAQIKVNTYPNPTTEMAYVTAESAIRSYEMVDALGRTVMAQENVNADILELNVSNLNAGIYFITITTDHGTATQRLSVTK